MIISRCPYSIPIFGNNGGYSINATINKHIYVLGNGDWQELSSELSDDSTSYEHSLCCEFDSCLNEGKFLNLEDIEWGKRERLINLYQGGTNYYSKNGETLYALPHIKNLYLFTLSPYQNYSFIELNNSVINALDTITNQAFNILRCETLFKNKKKELGDLLSQERLVQSLINKDWCEYNDKCVQAEIYGAYGANIVQIGSSLYMCVLAEEDKIEKIANNIGFPQLDFKFVNYGIHCIFRG